MIKNIIFDIGQVLVHFRYHEYMKELGFSEEIQDVFCKKIVENPLWSEFDLGIRETEDIISEMKSRVPEYTAEADLFFDRIDDIVESFPYARSWIADLKQRGYNVYLLSNYPRDMFDMHERDKFNFTDLVDGKIISGHVKMTKPNPEIYKLLCKTYGLKPEESIFLDDRKENIEAADKLGMHTILFQTYEQARDELNYKLKYDEGI